MRFDFELANAAHLESVMRTIKNIDSVFEVRSAGDEVRDAGNDNSGSGRRADD
jgi:hypothetical protein